MSLYDFRSPFIFTLVALIAYKEKVRDMQKASIVIVSALVGDGKPKRVQKSKGVEDSV